MRALLRLLALVLVQLPVPAAALEVVYVTPRIDEPCRGFVCPPDPRQLSSVRDMNGETFRELEALIVLEHLPGSGPEIRFFSLTPASGIPADPTFEASFIQTALVADGALDVLVTLDGERSIHRLEFDPQGVLKGLGRLDFVANLVPTLTIEMTGPELVDLHIIAVAVPEPAAVVTLLVASLGVLVSRQRG